MKDFQIVNAQEMRQLDKLTLNEKNLQSFDLMEHAGRSIFYYLIKHQKS